jgi:signal transduction histidine kinase
LNERATQDPTAAGDSRDDIARDIRSVEQIDAVPTILDVLCDLTGMRFAAVARVTEGTWTACAIKDAISFGLPVGGQLPVQSTLCLESKHLNEPIAINRASTDPKYRDHHTPRTYKIESYVSVPIVLASGRYFGNLCAIDPDPAEVNNPKVIGIFTRFAALIADALHNQELRKRDQAVLMDERAASELREQFIAILGHDLRNPLHAVIMGSELLLRKSDDAAFVAQIAGRIRTNSKRMALLVDDVVDFARGKLGGGIGVNLREVDDVNAALNSVIREFQDGQPERQILASISVAGPVRCDIGRIQQVASNLIGNALTHGAAQKPIRVSARSDDHYLILEVSNDGEPIAPESLLKIFQPFWRNSTSAAREGLGLGLHICSQIVQAHGGNLSVVSSRVGGTQFTVRLPLR